MSTLVHYETQGAVALITIDNPPLNVLSPGVPEGVLAAIAQAEADDAVKAMVLIGAGKSFIAGADIATFNMPRDKAPNVRGMVEGLGATQKPIIAALHGTALGGGLEAALACDYRVAVLEARMGTPEVKLGLLPGAGGTQRLPRVVGLEAALEMIVSGDPIQASRAHSLGLVDNLITGDLRAGALAYAEEVIAKGAQSRKVSLNSVRSEHPAEHVLAYARQQAAQKARGMVAPQHCIDAVEAAVNLPFEEGIIQERALFDALVRGPESKALRHIFFAERAANKVSGLAPQTQPIPLERAAVIGAGTMGSGIAMNFARAGVAVKLLEQDQDRLNKGLAAIRANYQRSVDKGKLTQDKMDASLALIQGVLSYDALQDVDYVIEAVFEDMEVKKQVFTQLDKVAPPHAILATNTSTLDVNAIAAVTKRPQNVLGMHFFSPANVMKLLEIVRSDSTSAQTLVTSLGLAKAMRKVPVVVGVCDGFVGNRMIHVYAEEANTLMNEGALPQQIDAAMDAFGMAMGPFAMSDLAGIDIGYMIRQRKAAENSDEPQAETVGDKLYHLGRLGQKSGAGYYRYEKGSRKSLADPDVDALVAEHRAALGITPREISDEEIQTRLICQLVNEGAHILAEGIAQRSSDIDVIYVYGYGFPPYKGGPMFYADERGLSKVLARIEAFAEGDGNKTRWEPAPLLKQLAENDQSFASYNRL